eukprot:350435-Chlamydomonas_euryale.AAC.5
MRSRLHAAPPCHPRPRFRFDSATLRSTPLCAQFRTCPYGIVPHSAASGQQPDPAEHPRLPGLESAPCGHGLPDIVGASARAASQGGSLGRRGGDGTGAAVRAPPPKSTFSAQPPHQLRWPVRCAAAALAAAAAALHSAHGLGAHGPGGGSAGMRMAPCAWGGRRDMGAGSPAERPSGRLP